MVLTLLYTDVMTDYGRFMRKPKAQKKPVDEALADAVVRGKRERQAVLQRVRRQRALIMKRLAAKIGRD
jgi:hypothetical protein